ncbi:penicillin-binding protein [Aquibacillus sp. 3ASR75-11]|uniref:serine-type D-Ala-D-Ala carboxypeptidase n=1 Tax=Terrihalobacillus insolitus TaxID=2950438 RepID=A0A9X3WT03_9BACI|nr:penicillin-binding protein [Terrihalobacillus insolitus]MDC3412828.1 penicillin-binding protein [Terrihalobacillus insolitus]MDC3423696.1 penicillin-binding protein [Terrihalobacillus insolitus]
MKKNNTTHFMSSVLMIGFVAIFLIISGRFLFIQGTGKVQGVSLNKWADEQRTTSYTLEAKRGQILDRNGMTLAYDRATYRLFAIVDESYTTNPDSPMHVKDPSSTAEALAPILDMDTNEIENRIQKGIDQGQFQVEFGKSGRELSQSTKEEIDKLNLPGIQFKKESIRGYPNGTFASRVIGLAQKENGNISGVTGIEKQMNEVLTGKQGNISYQRDLFNVKLLNPKEIVKEPENGDDIYLTIDQKIQTLLENSMSQVQEQYEPSRMTAIVMNPKTGEVLAMSNRPSYNPNNMGEVENWYNDAISTPFEPGSTMKIFTLASAIEEGVWDPNKMYKSGSYTNEQMNGVTINDWQQDWGTISFKEGIQRSSNVAAAKLAWEELGTETFLDYLKAFRFDQPTGIDLPGEVSGKILYNYPVEKVTTAFGQGSTVTPIQQMMAASAIANKGKMMRPYVVSKVIDSQSGDVLQENNSEVVGAPISPETAGRVIDVLETVITSDVGTGQSYKLTDYTVAGKTGTAEIPDSKTRNYMTGKENYIFSFLGMAPKEDPELIMYVSVKQPKLDPTESGSAPVSFIFKNVMENGLHYLNIEPDQDNQEEINAAEITDVVGLPVRDAQKKIIDLGGNPVVIGNGGTIKRISPKVGSTILPGERVLLVSDKPKMPDITGWSVRDVLRLGSLFQLNIETKGNGYGVQQSIKSGASLEDESNLAVEFSPPAFPSELKDGEKQDINQNDRTPEN